MIPCERNYTLIFEDVADAEDISVKVNGKKANAEIKKTENRIEITLNGVSSKDSAEVIFENFTARTNRDKKEAVIELVTKYQLPVSLKSDKFNSFINNLNDEIPMEQECFRGPIEEVLKMA